MRRTLVTLSLALACAGAAQTYSVRPGDGPLDLSEALAGAAAAWNEVVEETELSEEPGAATGFSYADPALLGPDVVSATLVREDEEGFDVWLNPDTIDEFPGALLHELGLLLGLPSADTGLMSPILSADTPAVPTEADLAALAALLGRAGGDIDGDGDVDISDLAALGRAYGQQGVNLAADLNGNGTVDAGDVELMRANYTFTEPQPVEEQEAGEEPQAEDPTTADPDDAGDDVTESGEDPASEPSADETGAEDPAGVGESR